MKHASSLSSVFKWGMQKTELNNHASVNNHTHTHTHMSEHRTELMYSPESYSLTSLR